MCLFFCVCAQKPKDSCTYTYTRTLTNSVHDETNGTWNMVNQRQASDITATWLSACTALWIERKKEAKKHFSTENIFVFSTSFFVCSSMHICVLLSRPRINGQIGEHTERTATRGKKSLSQGFCKCDFFLALCTASTLLGQRQQAKEKTYQKSQSSCDKFDFV